MVGALPGLTIWVTTSDQRFSSVYICWYDYSECAACFGSPWIFSCSFASLPSADSSVIHLHERWLKDCTFYREIYEQIDDVSLMPRIDWGPVFNTKQVSVITLSEHLFQSAHKSNIKYIQYLFMCMASALVLKYLDAEEQMGYSI